MPDFDDYIETHFDRFLEELNDWLRIPSISTDGAHGEEIERAAGWLMGQLRSAGVEHAEVIPTDGNPMVFAEHVADPAAPTVLIYGHYDVQPEDPADLWTSPAFEPTVRDSRLYARGTIDDKGQVYMHVKAVEAWLASDAGLPINVKFLIEGEEEVGSEHLAGFLAENEDTLACDAVLISDTAMLSRETPAITAGLRGIAYAELEVRGPSKDLHSGHYGGAVVNPAMALAEIIAALHDDDRRITVPGFYDRVRGMTEKEKRDSSRVPFDEEEFRAETGAPALDGEAGYTSLERTWYRPALDVNGIWGGFIGSGTKTVLPSKATAKMSFRLVPDQDPDEVLTAFERHVHDLAPEGVEVEVRRFHGGIPWVADPGHPVFKAADAALERSFGKPPVYVRDGGSIPIVPMFERTLDAPAVLVGFSLPGANLHAPDEWLDLEVWKTGIGALAGLYGEIGERGA